MWHILDSPARQEVAARGVAAIAASSSRLRAVSNDAGAAELLLKFQLQLPAVIDNSVVGSVAGVVAGEVAVDVAIADGVANVVACRRPNKQILLPNRRTFPPVAAETIAVPVPVPVPIPIPIPIPIDPSREVILGVENNNTNHNNENRDHQHQQHVRRILGSPHSLTAVANCATNRSKSESGGRRIYFFMIE